MRSSHEDLVSRNGVFHTKSSSRLCTPHVFSQSVAYLFTFMMCFDREEFHATEIIVFFVVCVLLGLHLKKKKNPSSNKRLRIVLLISSSKI